MEQPLIDTTDKLILNILQKNALQSVKEIADKVGLSASPTYERIKRMEKNGVIHKYVALLNKEKIEKELVAMCSVNLKDHSQSSLQKFEKAISMFDEIMEVYCMSGENEYLLKIVTKNVKSYHDFIVNIISSIDNIAKVHSSIVMHEIKLETAFKLK